MLAHAPAHTTLAVTNLERARKFYGQTLGLQEVPSTIKGEESVTFEAGNGTQIYLYQRDQPSGSTATACSFAVDNVESSVKSLQGKGVQFEEYDLPEIKTKNGIATLGDLKSAWFKDPDGNILAVGNAMKTNVRHQEPMGMKH